MTNPFDTLRQHAREQPDAIAASTPYRIASYQKMWSRIERSTARLQAEWVVLPGATIAYFGCGHLDALVMYLAAARCGVRLLPLEHPALREAARSLLRDAGATLVLHDDALPVDEQALGVPCRPLSSLIATPCRHRESVQEDSAAISLLEFAGEPGDASQIPRSRSLDALTATALACPAGHHVVVDALFDPGVFGPVVLATLLAGVPLQFTPNTR
ncbi:MAG: AMP-binding protein [Herminiimonas sp.]|nr:AMP-binding protein [Herminiimonas sp.]